MMYGHIIFLSTIIHNIYFHELGKYKDDVDRSWIGNVPSL